MAGLTWVPSLRPEARLYDSRHLSLYVCIYIYISPSSSPSIFSLCWSHGKATLWKGGSSKTPNRFGSFSEVQPCLVFTVLSGLKLLNSSFVTHPLHTMIMRLFSFFSFLSLFSQFPKPVVPSYIGAKQLSMERRESASKSKTGFTTRTPSLYTCEKETICPFDEFLAAIYSILHVIFPLECHVFWSVVVLTTNDFA